MNYLEVFIVRNSMNIDNREVLGRVPVASGEYEVEGKRIKVDLSGVNQRIHGPKIVMIDVEGFYPKDIALRRKTARGFQTIGNGTWLGVEAYSPIGLTRNR